MLIEGADYFIRVLDFPENSPCGGMVMLNDDGTYSVYLNARVNDERQKKAMRHEYDHMAKDDLYSDKPIEDIEKL